MIGMQHKLVRIFSHYPVVTSLLFLLSGQVLSEKKKLSRSRSGQFLFGCGDGRVVKVSLDSTFDQEEKLEIVNEAVIGVELESWGYYVPIDSPLFDQ